MGVKDAKTRADDMTPNVDVNSRVSLTKILSEIVQPVSKDFDVEPLKQCDNLKLIELANINYMNFALYQGIVKNRLEACFTDEQLAYLQEFYELNKQRNNDFLSELREVILVLNEYDIEPVLLKGAVALADNWYGGMGARFMRDIDFLVPEHQVDEAYKILNGMGYQEVMGEEEEPDHDGHHHCPALQLPDSALVIEVHFKPLSTKTKGVLSSQQVFSEKVLTNNLELGRCFIPSPTHCLMIAVLHSEISHGQRKIGVLFLRHAMDVGKILEKYKNIDYARIELQLISYGFGNLLSSYLFVASYFFNLKVRKGYFNYTNRDDEYLSVVLENMIKEGRKKKNKFDVYKKFTIDSFSYESISNRYTVNALLTVNICRVVNLGRLLRKYSNKRSWSVKVKYINSEIDSVKLIGK